MSGRGVGGRGLVLWVEGGGGSRLVCGRAGGWSVRA